MREVLKPVPERQGFQHLPRGPVDVNVSEKHVLSLLLYEIVLKSSFFPVPIMARKSLLAANVLKMLLPGQRLMSS